MSADGPSKGVPDVVPPTNAEPPSAEPSPGLGRGLFIAALIIAVLGIVTARVVISGEQELKASSQALEAGDPHEAIVRARRAASWYAPGAPHVGVAYQRLIALARGAETNHQTELALLAWRAVRSASLDSRWLLTPHAADQATANREIARLSATAAGAIQPEPGLLAEQLKALASSTPNRLGWAAALMAAFALGVVGLGSWSRAVAGAGGKLHWRRARVPAALVIVAIALWLVAVWQA